MFVKLKKSVGCTFWISLIPGFWVLKMSIFTKIMISTGIHPRNTLFGEKRSFLAFSCCESGYLNSFRMTVSWKKLFFNVRETQKKCWLSFLNKFDTRIFNVKSWVYNTKNPGGADFYLCTVHTFDTFRSIQKIGSDGLGSENFSVIWIFTEKSVNQQVRWTESTVVII